MDFEIVNGDIASLETECLIIAVEADSTLPPAAKAADEASAGYISEILKGGDISGKNAESLLLHKVPGLAAKRVLLLGFGKEDERNNRNFRKTITTAMGVVKSTGVSNITFALDCTLTDDTDHYRQLRHLVEWSGAELYTYDETKSTKADPLKLEQIAILVPEENADLAETALLDGTAIVNGMSIARDLGNLPGNICTPTHLAEQALELDDEFDDLTTTIVDEEEMAELGMHCLLSVGAGSVQPSKLIVMEYKGGPEGEKPHVLVGKGVTFDTGGISLKPGGGMDEMKYDMCGAASVFGAMTAVCEMALPINVVGIVAAAENMPSGNATKPGDIVTTMSGQTVEILNTDAEGRLVLCDALTYAGRFEPASVVDIATLTGACIIALGHHATGVLTNTDDLAQELIEASNQAADKAWQLPLWDEFQEQLDSNFADIANIGGRPGGTITAACFLSRFTKEYRWAHLDIAGVAWHSGGKAKGATGRCVPLLTQYLLNQAAEEE
ncbi:MULTISPECIES: leucyl aminopeptidase [unclassified Neptuniibacter]|uniref:leucyl aminopeptidase n=1 Tax=unclassified Neptuniibacter TaxID=2630693 RepID=UPI0026E33BE1|nr:MULTISPECIES: leucyl aminopeptidase [unclassified Neptuniibacter]MDO6515079.1 leucyl aminopeptidase [Neptuniibacter sp. 2_MG-2023]MDO6594865.1 leucyl aminopeptidase [Neptuniibacter sp. 1_MG-2023]